MDIIAYLIGFIPAFSALALLIMIAILIRNCYKNRNKNSEYTGIIVLGVATSLALVLFIIFYVTLILKVSLKM